MTAIFRAALVAAVLLALIAPAVAQQGGVGPKIWDIALGTHVADLPVADFTDPACGSNGGPPGQFIMTFANFGRCRPEASGLHEVWFVYDDEQEYVFRALARSSRWLDQTVAQGPAGGPVDPMVAMYRSTQVLQQPVILSLLINADGRVQGWRIITDPAADPDVRAGAHVLETVFKGRYGMDAWSCQALPPQEGERPIGAPPRLIKERCEKTVGGVRVAVETRNYYKPGQSLLDPLGRVMINEFESSARIEVLQVGPLPAAAPAAAATLAQRPAASPREAFLLGQTLDCPGCDLSGESLKRRDLTGANLAGANLEGASFHRAILRGVNFSGANLTYANMNKTILTNADLRDANLSGAGLYEAEAGRANFAGATMVEARMRRARLSLANLEGANLTEADLEDARITDALMRGAILNGANLYLAALFRADMRDVIAQGSTLAEASLRGAKLMGASLRGADLMAADLGGADLTNADISDSRLLRAILTDAILTGANLARSLMPDNTIHP